VENEKLKMKNEKFLFIATREIIKNLE